ncbi:hypothetical protein [Cyclobacterium marinum]|uniref:Uncharacterized protein n=1 Tax=Cyclobacterium marinum (strain ATCC 25205 / DSM 745 / LMG 13164 / NCIMB 1802) TaxID=880070 RepID=G0IW29_CYCMS|nr:hypothetical protein [Cyclobacterium marinum]AEL26249.1 hypothetical protein Cycma_2510 [Cyclobacterium marinum DSM 745]MBI0399592.1 hypothetical protein [Cyclobacterium marinum]MBR9773816.1 hypothetical protein [Cytophagales bacterium]|tara:strand:+ start:57716 stop:58132 length:417 start_codon:yes stop_codon:yes gene_type:complete
MNFPSIFRINRPSRFNINPRHYDPVKEEIKNRTEMIKKDLEIEGVLNPKEQQILERQVSGGSSRIRGAFTGGSPIKKQPSNIMDNTGLIRMIIIVLLVGGFGGYIYLGPVILYYLLYFATGGALLFGFFKLKGRKKDE